MSLLLNSNKWPGFCPASKVWTPSCVQQRTVLESPPTSFIASKAAHFAPLRGPVSRSTHTVSPFNHFSCKAGSTRSAGSWATSHRRDSNEGLRARHPRQPGQVRHASSEATSSLDKLRKVHRERKIPIVVVAVLAINGLVYVAWQYAHYRLKTFQDPRWILFMFEHFTAGYLNLYHGRWWTLFTSSFSHMEFMHLLVNMVTFAVVGPPVLALTGATTFLGLYLGASWLTNFVSLSARKYSLSARDYATGCGLGASGSVYGLLTAFTCVYPKAIFLLFMVLPVPAWALVGGVFVFDTYRAIETPEIRTDAAGHVGGILAGLLFWVFKLRRLRI